MINVESNMNSIQLVGRGRREPQEGRELKVGEEGREGKGYGFPQ